MATNNNSVETGPPSSEMKLYFVWLNFSYKETFYFSVFQLYFVVEELKTNYYAALDQILLRKSPTGQYAECSVMIKNIFILI